MYGYSFSMNSKPNIVHKASFSDKATIFDLYAWVE